MTKKPNTITVSIDLSCNEAAEFVRWRGLRRLLGDLSLASADDGVIYQIYQAISNNPEYVTWLKRQAELKMKRKGKRKGRGRKSES